MFVCWIETFLLHRLAPDLWGGLRWGANFTIIETQDWRVVLVSASAERFVGQARADILGHQVNEIFKRSSRLGQLVLHCFQYHEPMDQLEVETDSGRRIQVSLDFIEERGERIGALLTMRDTESVRKIERSSRERDGQRKCNVAWLLSALRATVIDGNSTAKKGRYAGRHIRKK